MKYEVNGVLFENKNEAIEFEVNTEFEKNGVKMLNAICDETDTFSGAWYIYIPKTLDAEFYKSTCTCGIEIPYTAGLWVKWEGRWVKHNCLLELFKSKIAKINMAMDTMCTKNSEI